MNYYVFTYRSLTFAQKSVKILDKAGIPSSIVRPPAEAAIGGCSYGVKIKANKYNAAVAALSSGGLTALRILETD